MAKTSRGMLLTMATAVPVLVYILRMVVVVTMDDAYHHDAVIALTGGPNGGVAQSAPGPGKRQSICGPIAPPPTNASCAVLQQSTKSAPQCGPPPARSKEYGLLVTGMSGNLGDAPLAWFRSRKISLSRDNSPPTVPFGSVSWVLAFNNWEFYPGFAKIESLMVRCGAGGEGRCDFKTSAPIPDLTTGSPPLPVPLPLSLTTMAS